MNSSVDRADLGDSSYAGVKYVVVSGNQLTCIQRICSLATRDNHLHRLTSSKNDVIRIEDVRIRSIRSRANFICASDKLVRECIHSGEIEREMVAEGSSAFNLVMAAIKGTINISS